MFDTHIHTHTICIHKYNLLSSLLLMGWGLTTLLYWTTNMGVHLYKRLIFLFPAVLLAWGKGPCEITPFLSIYNMSFQSCFMQPFLKEFTSRLPSILCFRVFPSFLQCPLSHRCRRCVVDVSIGAGLLPSADLCIVSTCGFLGWPLFALMRGFFDGGGSYIYILVSLIFLLTVHKINLTSS